MTLIILRYMVKKIYNTIRHYILYPFFKKLFLFYTMFTLFRQAAVGLYVFQQVRNGDFPRRLWVLYKHTYAQCGDKKQ